MSQTKANFTTISAIVMTFIMIAVAVALGGSAKSFIDYPAILIVICGTLLVLIASFSLRDLGDSCKLVFNASLRESSNPTMVAEKVIDLCSKNRKSKHILDMQKYIDSLEHTTLKRGMQMIIDGVKADAAESLLHEESASRLERHKRAVAILRRGADIAPAMGLIGTLIGLVQMLGRLDDPATIGPAMAVALLTTLYGAILAYVFFSPLASKMERNSMEEYLSDMVSARGIVAIDKKENPSQAAMIINSILPPGRHIPETEENIKG